MRYLFPLPVPQRWRRRLMALGSGHPTRIICSALIAQAFETVRYPILPKVARAASEAAWQDILEIRHSSLYAPRDFDISPYFEVVKPTLVRGFDYKTMAWADLPIADDRELMSLVPARHRGARNRHVVAGGLIRDGLAHCRGRPYLCPHVRRGPQSAFATVHAAAARGADEGGRPRPAADRHRRHRPQPHHQRAGGERRDLGRARPGVAAARGLVRRSPGFCRSWQASASSPAPCS